MLYIIVLSGSLLGVCALFGARALLRTRSVRRFVRSIKQRFQFAEERGAVLVEEKKVDRPRKSPRVSAIELQQVRSLVRMADKAMSQENVEEAERLFIQALTVQPHAIDVQAELAKLYLTTSRESKAEAMYKELLPQRDDVSFHANLGLAYYRQGKFLESCQAYQEALNRDAQNPERSSALGRACIAAHRFEEAAPLLEKATQRLARDTTLLHLLAECYLQLGYGDKAEETYRRINRIEPYNEDVKSKLVSLARA
ncbi:tetratricopeptide repeat protein [Candidatus Peregrinibacteria bacterium]|nr:tetratricopeptide repeat protein [Candidatus Peregrinibacteria bacterium]MBI3817023.1 tetratricopeptide repeat protein [Candidatus Peregrinibacteria bacterium]